jgi:protein-S-isoprenylcysteine O-methyltransferase Ste14
MPVSSPSVKTRSPPNIKDVQNMPGEGRKPVTVESMEDLLQELVDPQKFGTRGELWFFAQMVLIALIAFPPGGIRQIVDVLGGCFLVFGLAFIALGGLNLGQNLTPVPKPRDVHFLVTDGIYSVVRHPMYGGIILCGLGLSLSSGDEARLALTALTFYVLDQKATVEEEYLEEKYLEEYKEYKKSGVKKLIPWLY